MIRVSGVTISGGLLILGALVWFWTGSEPPKPKPTAPLTAGPRLADVSSDYVPADYTAKFETPKQKLRDVFMPVVKVDTGPGVIDRKGRDLMRIPPEVAQGDPNWIYTGFAEVDGARTALFENSSTHQSGLVKAGATWKAGRVLKIQSDEVVMSDSSGTRQVITRFQPDLSAQTGPPGSATAGSSSALPSLPGVAPVNLGAAIQGPIGGDISVQPLPRVRRRRVNQP